MLNLYLVKSPEKGYDIFTEMVVAAKSRKEAMETHPNGKDKWLGSCWKEGISDMGWPEPERLSVSLIGTAKKNIGAGVISSSFNAG